MDTYDTNTTKAPLIGLYYYSLYWLLSSLRSFSFYLDTCASSRRSSKLLPRSLPTSWLWFLPRFTFVHLTFFWGFCGYIYIYIYIYNFIMRIQSFIWPFLGWRVVDALTVDTSQAGMFVLFCWCRRLGC